METVPYYFYSFQYSFQVGIVTNGDETFLILRYFTGFQFGSGGGYESQNCNWEKFLKTDKSNLETTLSNTGRNGMFIFKIYDDVCIDEGM